MKRILLIVLIAMLTMAFAAPVFAATFGPGATNTTVIGSANLVPSTSVTINALATAQNYCATAQHSSSDPTRGGLQFEALNTESTMKSATANSSGVPTACQDAVTPAF